MDFKVYFIGKRQERLKYEMSNMLDHSNNVHAPISTYLLASDYFYHRDLNFCHATSINQGKEGKLKAIKEEKPIKWHVYK